MNNLPCVRVCNYTCSTFPECKLSMVLWRVGSRVHGIQRHFALADPSGKLLPQMFSGMLALFIQGTVPVSATRPRDFLDHPF